MSTNGNGGKPTFEEALKELGPPRDRIDQLAFFVARQSHDLAGAIDTQVQILVQRLTEMSLTQTKALGNLAELQARTTGEALTMMAEKIASLEREIVALRGSQAAEEKGRLQ